MRSWLLLAMAPMVAVALACGEGEAPADGRLRVVATTVQVGALAREAGGDRIELRVLAGAGVDPHDYQATANDLKALRNADVVLRNGLGLDSFLDKAISGSGGKAAVVTVTEGVAVRLQPGTNEPDPHAWQNPQLAEVMTRNIAIALGAADAPNELYYRENAAVYGATLREADREIRSLIETIPRENRKMVTDHDAFGYFIDYYGLTYIGTVIPGVSSQAESSAKALAALADTIRREGVKAIFAERSLDPKVARQLAKDTGVRIVDDLLGDSLGPPGSETGTIHGMLLFNARRIAEALK